MSLASIARRRRPLPDGHRRTRVEDPTGRRRGRNGPASLRRLDRPLVRRRVEAAEHFERRLHPHHRDPPSSRSPKVASSLLRQWRHRTRHLSRSLLRPVRGVLHGGRSRRRQLPDPQEAGGTSGRGELLLPSQSLRGSTSEVVRRPSRCDRSRLSHERGHRVHQTRTARFEHQSHQLLLGHPIAVGRQTRHLRVVRRLGQLHHRCRLRNRRRSIRSTLAGRLPHDRQGHHSLPLRVLAGDADVGRHRAAQGMGRGRLAARRWRRCRKPPGTS